MSDDDGPDLSIFSFGEEEDEQTSEASAKSSVAQKQPQQPQQSKAAKKKKKKEEEERAREARIAEAKRAPEPQVTPRMPGAPAALGELGAFLRSQPAVKAVVEDGEELLLALQRLYRKRDGEATLEAMLVQWEAAARVVANPACSPTYRWRAISTSLSRSLPWRADLFGFQRLPATQPPLILLGDSHFERLGQSTSIERLGDRCRVHAVGGDGVQHLLMRLHLSHRQLAGAAAFVVMIGINNLLGGAAETKMRRAKQNSPAQVAEGVQLVVDLLTSMAMGRQLPIFVSRVMRVIDGDAETQDKWLSPPASETNALVDELNDHLVQLQRCQFVPLEMPLEPALFQRDGIHLSPAGMDELVRQLLKHVDLLRKLAAVSKSTARS